MPVVKAMADIEIAALQAKSSGGGQRKAIELEYDRLLQPYDVGSYCTVDLAEDEVDKKQTIRNRLVAAAERRGFVLHFIRTTGPLLRFQVKAKDEGATLDMFGPAQTEEEEGAPVTNGRKRGKVEEVTV